MNNLKSHLTKEMDDSYAAILEVLALRKVNTERYGFYPFVVAYTDWDGCVDATFVALGGKMLACHEVLLCFAQGNKNVAMAIDFPSPADGTFETNLDFIAIYNIQNAAPQNTEHSTLYVTVYPYECETGTFTGECIKKGEIVLALIKDFERTLLSLSVHLN